ncbi:hypothetical protein PQQ51_00905 [Paraburkholderia xenovorans]|uniref:hypothetical protein n=1 Tax=Paraburkholderia xenovorans TaxID=36873 RepID=UPI0038BBDE81
MTFRPTLLAVSVSLLVAAAPLTAVAQAAPDSPSQWRPTPLTLSNLLQDGYKIVAVVNGARGNAGMADTIFVQRDQSAFKCIDPQQPDARTKAACFELVQPSGPAPDAK